MALKLRRPVIRFTNRSLAPRICGPQQDSLGTGAPSFKRVLGCSAHSSKDWLIPSLELRPPSLTLVKLLGTLVIPKNRERQLRVQLGARPLLSSLKESPTDALAFRFASYCEDRHMAVCFIREIITARLQQDHSYDATGSLLCDQHYSAVSRL